MKIESMLLTPNPYSRPGARLQKVNAVTVHYVGNPGTSAINNRNYFENLKDTHKSKASSHYIVGLQGEILQLVPETEWSYCTNKRNGDTISIEACHPDSTGKFSQATYDSFVELCADICKRHGLDPLNGCLIRHYDVTGKLCPKWFVDQPQEWERFKQEVKIKMKNNIKDTKVTIGTTEVPAKLIDNVTYVPLRGIVDAIKEELEVTWDKAKGAGIDF